MAGRADAENLQQVRRVDGTAADHDLSCRDDPAVAASLAERDTSAPASVKQQPGRHGLCLDPEVGPPPCFREKGARGRPTEPPPARHLRIADPLLNRAVVVWGERKTRLLRGF